MSFSLASILCCSPSVNLLPSSTLPLKASMIATTPSFTIYSWSILKLQNYEGVGENNKCAIVSMNTITCFKPNISINQ